MMVRIYKKKTEVEKSSSMPTCQHHDNGSDHNTNDKYKAPRRRQLVPTYVPTYYLPHHQQSTFGLDGLSVMAPTRERGQGAPRPQSSRPPLSWVRREKTFHPFFKYFVPKYWEISLTEWGAGGMEGSMRKRYSSITVCSSQQQKCRHWAVIHDLFLHHLTCKLKKSGTFRGSSFLSSLRSPFGEDWWGRTLRSQEIGGAAAAAAAAVVLPVDENAV
jgi:hypothetical protein